MIKLQVITSHWDDTVSYSSIIRPEDLDNPQKIDAWVQAASYSIREHLSEISRRAKAKA